MVDKLILAEVRQDFKQYKELDEKRRILNFEIKAAVSKSKTKGELFHFEYNSTTPVIDGRSFYHINQYGTKEQQKQLWDMYYAKEALIAEPERKTLILIDAQLVRLRNKYDFLVEGIYIGWPEGNEYKDFLKLIVGVLEHQEGS